MQLDRTYWNDLYANGDTGWDLGGPSTPLREYIDGLKDKDLRILIPGGGRSYEAEHAHRKGFRNVFVIDLTDAPLKDLLKRCPDFPPEHFIVGDFFTHEGAYDRILEQTFFCALAPTLRPRYVEHMHRLLKPGGRLVGVLFDDTLNTDRPPFGGSKEVYLPLFTAHFPGVSFTPCYNSIKPREGRELWLRAEKSIGTTQAVEAAYTPIDCNLYDHYESAATLRTPMRLTTTDGTVHSGIITDLFVKENVEYVRLESGTTLRLDLITRLEKAQD